MALLLQFQRSIGKLFISFNLKRNITKQTNLFQKRYQGDENDIVILSLVRVNPGNRFVGLQNRFVVAVSRARLGFFVIGSVKAVVNNRNGSEGPAHWRRFVSSLSPKVEKEQQSENGSRCGNALPICCPRHGGQVKLNVSKASDFPVEKSWNKFCSLPCQAVLDR